MMPSKNEDVVCQNSNRSELSSCSRKNRNFDDGRVLRTKRTRTTSGSIEFSDQDIPSSTCRRSRRHTGAHTISNQVNLESYSQEDDTTGEQPQISMGPLETIDELSLASSVFVDHQLFHNCDSPNPKENFLPKTPSNDNVCVEVSKSVNDPVTCNTAGLIIVQDEEDKIDTPNTQVDQEDVGSTEGEDADECVEEDACQNTDCTNNVSKSHHECGRPVSPVERLAIDTDELSSQPLMASIASTSSTLSHQNSSAESKQLISSGSFEISSVNSSEGRLNKTKFSLSRRATLPALSSTKRRPFNVPKAVVKMTRRTKHNSDSRASTEASSNLDTDASSVTEDYSLSSLDCGNLTFGIQSESGSMNSLSNDSKRVYPLRSRLKKESMLKEYHAKQVSPKSFIEIPTEVLLRIMHYLSIQDLFRIQVVCKRMQSVVDRYLLLVKRINFSSGLPFAYLPASMGDNALKRILSRTPEVTHILGFYPRVIHNTNMSPSANLQNPQQTTSNNGVTQQPSTSSTRSTSANSDILTYSGIIESFSKCTKLRSVELMDVQLMSQLVNFLPRVKFHGMFRNRPDSWDNEYAVPLPPEPHINPTISLAPPINICNTSSSFHTNSNSGDASFFSWWLSTLYGMLRTVSHLESQSGVSESIRIENSVAGAQLALSLSQAAAQLSNRLALVFEPMSEAPIGQGSPFASLVSPGTTPQAPPVVFNNVQILQVVAGGLPEGVPIDLLPEWLARAQQRLIGVAPIAPHPQQAQGIPANVAAQLPILPQARRQAILMLAIAAALNWIMPEQGNIPDVPVARPVNPQLQQLLAAVAGDQVPPALRHIMMHLIVQMEQQSRDQGSSTSSTAANSSNSTNSNQNSSHQHFVTPIPSIHDRWVSLPNNIANLTKLDLVSVAINIIPRLDNIKYLHLKWVHFANFDPFGLFSAPKLQSFVMNNCVGPSRVLRYVRIFAALSRATQLSRLELVGCRFFDGLIENLTDNSYYTPRCFRSLQRLVLAGNRDVREIDLGILLIAAQHSLCHFALQTYHTKNSLFEALLCAGVTLNKLESLVLGYQDPYQSRLTVNELNQAELVDSADNIMPICSITDRGLENCLRLSPRLSCLTIRHAPFLQSMRDWRPLPTQDNQVDDVNAAPQPEVVEEEDDDDVNVATEDESDVNNATNGRAPGRTFGTSGTGVHHHTHGHHNHSTPFHGDIFAGSTHGTSVRSLTIENCPGLNTQTLEDSIYFGDPFPCLETVVLRNMFLPKPGPCDNFEIPESWESRWAPRSGLLSTSQMRQQFKDYKMGLSESQRRSDNCEYRLASMLLMLADSLCVYGVGNSPLSKTGIGLGTSCREVSMQSALLVQLRPMDRLPWNIFLALRAHSYINMIMQLDGSCGSNLTSRMPYGRPLIQSVLFGKQPLFYKSSQWSAQTNNSSKRRRDCSVSTETSDCSNSRDWINANYPRRPCSSKNVDAPSFISQSTQTCICGLLEVDALIKLTHPNLSNELVNYSKKCVDVSSEDEDSIDNQSLTSEQEQRRKRTRSFQKANINFIIKDGDVNSSACTETCTASTVGQRRRNSLQVRKMVRVRRRFSIAPRHSEPAQQVPIANSTTPSSSRYVIAHGPDGIQQEPMPYLHPGHDRQPQFHNQLEGPFAFHPMVVSGLHARLYYLHTNHMTSWNRRVALKMVNNLYPQRKSKSRSHKVAEKIDTEVPLVTQYFNCISCCSNPQNLLNCSQSLVSTKSEDISALQPECHKHTPRVWLARDACVDTTELRCTNGSNQTQVLTISQPMRLNYCCLLTTLHFEKVGVTHIVLKEVPRLKNLALENCQDLKGIIISENDISSAVPALRRVRIIRCPKFAILHWLYQCAKLYPRHDENLFITYRPFGQYNSAVERALWDHCSGGHVLISSDYKQQESERHMEEFHSSFDQLFREVMSFSDMLIRRELVQTTQPRSGGNYFSRSEHGADWDIVTDIPWVHEVCCSMLPTNQNSKASTSADYPATSGATVRPTTAYSTGSSSDQVDQLYELLSEVQCVNHPTGQSSQSNGVGLEVNKTWKVARRGIHLHVQYRDVHDSFDENSQISISTKSDPLSHWFKSSSWYMKYAYTENYLSNIHPINDLNFWDDDLDWNTVRLLPRQKSDISDTFQVNQCNMDSWQRVLLSQEEPEKEMLPDEKQLLLQHIRKHETASCSNRKRTSLMPQSQLLSDITSGSEFHPKRRRTINGTILNNNSNINNLSTS